MTTRELALSLHLQYPKTYIAFSRGFYTSPSPGHYGVDMAWNYNEGGPYVPVYAPADGTVKTAGWHDSYGYHVIIEHAKGVRTVMAHMQKDSLLVSVGQKVKRGQQVGTEGSTGNSDGPHVHFEVRLDGVKVNPVPLVFAFPEQKVNKYTQSDYGIKHYEPTPTIGKPVAKNKMVDQIEVLTDTLNARKAPGLKGEKLGGYVTTGIYNVTEFTDLDDYRWYKTDQDFWFANDKEETWCHYYPTEYVGVPVERNEEVNQIKVTATTLRARKAAILEDSNILGFVNPGIYNCIGRTANAGYLWFKAEDEWDDFWCAQKPDGDWVEFLPAKVPHYNLTMKKLNEAQKSVMEAWCKSENVEYTIEDA